MIGMLQINCTPSGHKCLTL
uniref:Uncharacterized protein n=1 Tax=Arundo donax TaxID=35708 RepID=A0A0A9SVY2_ARUDO